MLRLRHYQDEVKGRLHSALARYTDVLGVMPTGAGKTVTFSALINEHNGASAAVVHRKEILTQISLSLAALGIKHRVVAPKKVQGLIRRKHLKKSGRCYIDPAAPCGVVSAQTLTSKGAANRPDVMAWVNQVTLAVFDEGHHYVRGGQWGRAVRLLGNARRLFVTATPERADGVGLGCAELGGGGFAQVMVEGPTMRWLMGEGYLSKYVYKAPSTDLNLDDIPLTARGEVSTEAMRKRVVESSLVGDVVDQYLEFTPGRKAIVFANDVETARDIAREFSRRGVKAAALSGDTDDGVRERTIDEFESGDLSVLVNCDLFDEGFDVPAVDVVILARVTASLGKYLQMVGRALRPVYAAGYDLTTAAGRLAAMAAGPKPAATVIDPVRNWERHGMPHWPRAWKLSSREKGTRAGPRDTLPMHVCGKCTQPYEKVLAACPYCGEPAPAPESRASPEKVAGNLFDLDVEAMDALFQEIAAADMGAEEFAADMARRNVPPVGRARQARAHEAAKYRRKVLRGMVEWWVGAQDKGLGRDMAEIHKRFFYRFGVDIGNAFKLNEKDTNALIERITRGYDKDLAA